MAADGRQNPPGMVGLPARGLDAHGRLGTNPHRPLTRMRATPPSDVAIVGRLGAWRGSGRPWASDGLSQRARDRSVMSSTNPTSGRRGSLGPEGGGGRRGLGGRDSGGSSAGPVVAHAEPGLHRARRCVRASPTTDQPRLTQPRPPPRRREASALRSTTPRLEPGCAGSDRRPTGWVTDASALALADAGGEVRGRRPAADRDAADSWKRHCPAGRRTWLTLSDSGRSCELKQGRDRDRSALGRSRRRR
jgi:hypothetical protein